MCHVVTCRSSVWLVQNKPPVVVAPWHVQKCKEKKKKQQQLTTSHLRLAKLGVDVPDDGASGNCTGPGWSRGTGTALWSGSSLRCGPEEVSGQIRGGWSGDGCYSPVQSELTHRLQDVHSAGLSELLAADAAHDKTARPSDACTEGTQNIMFHEGRWCGKIWRKILDYRAWKRG